MVKIAMLCPRTPRLHSAGVENSVIHVSKGLKDAGFEVEIFTTAKKPKKDAEISGIKIREFPAFAPNEAYFFSPQLYFALKKSDADIIHCNGYNNLVTLAGLFAKKKDQKLVITLNSSGPSSKIRRTLWLPYTFIFNMLSHKVDLFICVSNFEYEIFTKKLRAPKERFVVIPNGVDVEFIDSIEVERKGNYIISIGRLVKNKGFHHLIKALPGVLEEFPNLKLKIVGDGPYRKTLEELVEKLGLEGHVEFIEWIPLSQRTKLIKLLKAAKAFIFLSNYESQGIVVSEAIAAGVPCIVAKNSALKEFVENAGAVGVKNPKNTEKVAEKIVAVLKEPEKFKPNKKAVWSWEKVVERTVREFKKLATTS